MKHVIILVLAFAVTVQDDLAVLANAIAQARVSRAADATEEQEPETSDADWVFSEDDEFCTDDSNGHKDDQPMDHQEVPAVVEAERDLDGEETLNITSACVDPRIAADYLIFQHDLIATPSAIFFCSLQRLRI